MDNNHSDEKRILFEQRANTIGDKNKDFFDNHPLSVDGDKKTILDHCYFFYDNGIMKFSVVDAEYLPTGVEDELRSLFREIYLHNH